MQVPTSHSHDHIGIVVHRRFRYVCLVRGGDLGVFLVIFWWKTWKTKSDEKKTAGKNLCIHFMAFLHIFLKTNFWSTKLKNQIIEAITNSKSHLLVTACPKVVEAGMAEKWFYCSWGHLESSRQPCCVKNPRVGLKRFSRWIRWNHSCRGSEHRSPGICSRGAENQVTRGRPTRFRGVLKRFLENVFWRYEKIMPVVSHLVCAFSVLLQKNLRSLKHWNTCVWFLYIECFHTNIYIYFTELYPPKMNECPLKGDHFLVGNKSWNPTINFQGQIGYYSGE